VYNVAPPESIDEVAKDSTQSEASCPPELCYATVRKTRKQGRVIEIVIDRYVTQGTRSDRRRAASERIWTVIATCAMQGRSAFEFIRQAVYGRWHNESLLFLLPDTG